MMRLKRKNSPLRLLIWLIPTPIIVVVILNWASLARLFTEPQALPSRLEAATQAAADSALVIPAEELAPDGFPIRARPHVLKYAVQPGDALLLIAERFNISPNTILWSNTETLRDDVDLILVGTVLYILPVDGVYHRSDGQQTVAEIAALYGVEPSAILGSEFNDTAGWNEATIPLAGLRLVVPGGRRAYLTWQSPFLTGSGNGQANPQGVSHPGSCRERYAGAGGSGVYENPVHVPYRVTTGFEPWHPGIDLAADRDTPIYAADTGVVVFSGWHRVGYGELVIIDHGGGWTTYYGHLSRRFVGCGDQIAKGQQIGLMGATGNASGIHLHFEIRQNDAPLSPYNYVSVHDARDNPSAP